MSLTEKLLAVDVTKYKEKRTKTFELKQLSEIVGEPFFVEIQEPDDNRMQELQAMLLDENGSADYSKVRGVNALLCVENVIEPNLKDEKLQKHFKTATPKELAEIIFKGDSLGAVADEITNLYSYKNEENQKN